MLKLTEIKNRVRNLESRIIANKRGGNRETFELYSLIGLYKSLGGKEDLVAELKTSGILQHLPTDKARETYVMHAISYSVASEVYLILMRHTKSAVRKKYKSLLLPELLSYINKNARQVLDKYNIELRLVDMHCVGVCINTKHISNYQINDINELETVYINIANALLGIKLEDYMIGILHGYLD